VLGVAAIGAEVALCMVAVVVPLSIMEEISLAPFIGLSFLAGIALLELLVVSIAELMFRLPVRLRIVTSITRLRVAHRRAAALKSNEQGSALGSSGGCSTRMSSALVPKPRRFV
jgi:hypothetical protein